MTPEQLEKMQAGKRSAAELRARDAEIAREAAAAELKARLEPVAAMPPIAHEGVSPAAAIVDPDDSGNGRDDIPESADDFERFLAAQDDDIRELLSDVELRVIFEAETKRAQEERKAQARKTAAARAQRHAKATAGLLPAEAVAAAALRDRLSQKVKWTVNMPEAGNSGMLTDAGVRINGRLLVHGTEVIGTLAEYDSYRSIEWNAHQGELDFQGRGKLSKLRQTATGFLNMKGASL